MTASGRLYLDYAATTPVDPAVVDAVARTLASGPGNPSSDHEAGRCAAATVESARGRVAGLIGGRAAEIVWTSGATEADALAILGGARQQRARGRGDHVVTLATAHRAVLAPCAELEAEGFRVTRLAPDRDGALPPERLAEAVTERTCLITLLHVNNETGVCHDIAAMGHIARRVGALLHVDASQSAGRLPIDVGALPVDLLSLSAHKLYGPQGVGALWVRSRPRVRLKPLFSGGGQENGLRGGTLAVHQIVGMGEAFRLACERFQADDSSLRALSARLRRGLAGIPGLVLNGRADGAPHIVNVSPLGVHGESLAALLDADLCVSAGSACSSHDREPSHVLRAMGRPDALAAAAVRLSLGRGVTERMIDAAVERLAAAVQTLRAVSPLWREIAAGSAPELVYGVDGPLGRVA